MRGLADGHPRSPIYRGEHHVVTFRWNNGHVKLFRIQFYANALFVNFPYQPDALGIHARCSVGPEGEATIDVTEEGRKTTKKIKYSHPIDGRCHFSQAGQIVTTIRNVGPRLDNGAAHLFSVDIQGAREFEPFEKARRGESYTTFADPVDDPPRQCHIVARWMPLPADDIDVHTNPLEVEVPVPGAYRGVFMACAPLPGSPLDGHLLLLEFFSVVPLEANADSLLLFVGGFGADLGNRDEPSDFLFLQYPIVDIPELESADFVRAMTGA
jgi:hypothetical protein